MTQPPKKDTPAFPPNAGWRDSDPACRGMSLREWYAGMALMGILANPNRIGGSAEEVANSADYYADAMLAQRDR